MLVTLINELGGALRDFSHGNYENMDNIHSKISRITSLTEELKGIEGVNKVRDLISKVRDLINNERIYVINRIKIMQRMERGASLTRLIYEVTQNPLYNIELLTKPSIDVKIYYEVRGKESPYVVSGTYAFNKLVNLTLIPVPLGE